MFGIYLLEGEQVSATLVTFLTVSVAAVPVAEAGLVLELLPAEAPALWLELALEPDGFAPSEAELAATGMPETDTSCPM